MENGRHAILMRIFKNKWFAKYAKSEGISDEKLVQAVKDIEDGNIDADYGGGVIKQRISRPGEGKSGGYRTIIIYRQKDAAFFLFGFAKSVMSNISRSDVKDFKKYAKILLSYTEEEVKAILKTKELEEVKDEKNNSEEDKNI